jgi:hypothetical protein
MPHGIIATEEKEKERALVFSEERSKLKKLKKRWFAGFFSIYQLNRW